MSPHWVVYDADQQPEFDISENAMNLHVRAVVHCQRHQLEVLSTDEMGVLVMSLGLSLDDALDAVAELVRLQLWQIESNGFRYFRFAIH